MKKTVSLSYADDAYIDFVRLLNIKQSTDTCLVQNVPNRKEGSWIPFVKAWASILLYVVGAILILISLINESYVYLLGMSLLMFGILGGRHLLNWLFNSKIALLDEHNLYISSRPFPIFDNQRKMIGHTFFKQFYVQPQTGQELLSGGYALMGIDQRNRHYQVCAGNEKYMLMLEKEIEQFLEIKDIPVGGSLDNPYKVDED